MKDQAKVLAKKIIPVSWHDEVKTRARKIKYYGKRYYCNVCESLIREWHPLGLKLKVIEEKEIIGAGYRLAMCPVCFASDRVRLLHLFLSEKVKFYGHPHNLLHIAPEEPLRNIIEKDQVLDYLTADLMQEEVMEKMDITQINYPENTFDVIICNHVLEHIPDDRLAMQELFRVLKSGGWAILQVPLSGVLQKTFEDSTISTPEEREQRFGQFDHVRIYGTDYTNRLASAGFNVQPWQWTSDPEIRKVKYIDKLGLNPDEKVFYCIKPKTR